MYLSQKAIFLSILIIFSIPLAYGASGAIWTTRKDCGSIKQNVNHYYVGEHVFINGENFDANHRYYWMIRGQPGKASCDPNNIVASGMVSTDNNGNICFDAYVISESDCGEYKATLGNKKDNYRVIKSDDDEEWDKSSIEVTGECSDNMAVFTITNTGEPGEGDMDGPSEYRVYRNGVLEDTQNFQLEGGESLVIEVDSSGDEIKLEADQRPGHPGSSNPNEILTCPDGVPATTSSSSTTSTTTTTSPITSSTVPITTTTTNPCVLIKAYWSKTSVMEEENVQLIVNGKNCDGKTVDLVYFEDDDSETKATGSFSKVLTGKFLGALVNKIKSIFGAGSENDPINPDDYNLPKSLTFYDNIAGANWKTIWFEDTDGIDNNPEIIFESNLDDQSIISNTLKIYKLGVSTTTSSTTSTTTPVTTTTIPISLRKYTQSCLSDGSCSCKVGGWCDDVTTRCPQDDCSYSCPPPKDYSSTTAIKCAVETENNCKCDYVDDPTNDILRNICFGGECNCKVKGVCEYICYEGYVYDYNTKTCIPYDQATTTTTSTTSSTTSSTTTTTTPLVTEYTKPCRSSGSCSCQTGGFCNSASECKGTSTCSFSCPSPKLHSTLVVKTCKAGTNDNCKCEELGLQRKTCAGGTCSCSVKGLCKYECNDGYYYDGQNCVPKEPSTTVVTTTTTLPQECTDSDGGTVYYERGETSGYEKGTEEFKTVFDSCFSDGKTLREYYCDGKYYDFVDLQCPHSCESGVCKGNTTTTTSSTTSSTTTSTTTTTVPTTTSCSCGSWSTWKNSGCGKNPCKSYQMKQTRTRTCTPSGCNTETQTQCISCENDCCNSYCINQGFDSGQCYGSECRCRIMGL